MWRANFYGLVTGSIIKMGLPLFVEGTWVSMVGWVILLITTSFGVLVGASLDWRDDLSDF